MSVEHQPNSVEQNEATQAELEALGKERLEELATKPEAGQDHQEKSAEAARETIKQVDNDAPEPSHEPAAPASFVARVNHVVNYSQTMQSVQRHLSPVSQSFSKIIHSPVIETTSEVLEKTVLRPSVTNGALWTAAIVGLFFYLVARHYGYVLSGSELLLSLIAGGLIGGLLELLGRALVHRRP